MEISPGSIFKAFRDPLGTAWDMAKGAADPEKLISAPGMLEKVTGYAGRSILVDPTTEATEALKNPNGVKRDFFGTIFHFLKKRVVTLGILGGILFWVASIVIGKVQSASENPNPLLGTIAMGAKALILAAPIASIYGQIMRNVEKVANIDPSIFLRSKGNEIIEKFDFAKKVNEAALKKAKEKTIVLSSSEKSRETAIIQNISKDKPIKSIIMGPESSGKVALANKISAQISEVEAVSADKRAVVVETINCSEVLTKLRQQASQNQSLKEFFSALTSQIPGLALSGPQLAEAVIYGVEQRIDVAKNQGNERRVVQLINVESLWWLAARKEGPDTDLISKIENALCSLLSKDNKYDIIITSNVPGDKTLGLNTIYGEHLKQTNLGESLSKSVDALYSESISINNLDDSTKLQVIASAIAQKLNIPDERTIRVPISKAIEYMTRNRLVEIDTEFETAVKNSKATGEPFYMEDQISKIRDFYTTIEKFKNLKTGDVYSLMDKITVSDNVKENLLNVTNNEEKKKAALYIIDEFIKFENLDPLGMQTVEEQVKAKETEMQNTKRSLEDIQKKCSDYYADGTIRGIIGELGEMDEKKLAYVLCNIKQDNEDLFNVINFVIRNSSLEQIKNLKKKVDQSYHQKAANDLNR